MKRLARGPWPGGLAALGVAFLLASSTTRDRPSATVDLLSRFDDADCRSDRIDLGFLLSRTLLKHRGWERVDDPGTRVPELWLSETDGRFELPFATTSPKTLSVTARCKRTQAPGFPVVVSLNGRVLATLPLDREERAQIVEIPASAQVAGRNELRFEARRRVALPRPLLLSRLEIAPVAASGGDPALRSRDGLWIPPAARVAYPLRRSEPGAALEIDVRGGERSGRLRVALEAGGRESEVAMLDVPAGRVTRRTVPLPAMSEPFGRLALGNPGPGGVWIPVMRLVVPLAEAPPPAPPTPAASPSVRTSVILFVADAVRADSLGAYGNPRPTSPRFDAFTRQGCRFDDVTAQSSWTRPCIASVLTGLGVDAHGVGGLTNTLGPALTTVPEVFQAAGYRTAAFVANDVLSPGLGFAQGFDSWETLAGRRPAEVVEAALSWIGSGRGPFFVYVHTLGAHRPLQPEARFWRPLIPASLPRNRDVAALVLKPHLEEDELSLVRSAYEGEVREDDAAFGELLDGLDARGLGGRTAIAFTADHGEALQEHGRSGHGGTLYQELLHVPLAMRGPGIPAGGRFAGPVPHSDLAPTLVRLAGLTPPPEAAGSNLVEACAGPGAREAPPRPIVSRLTYQGADKVAVRLGALKLVVNEEPGVAPSARFELFDLDRDPRESENLAARMPEAVEYLWGESRRALRADEATRTALRAGRTRELTSTEKRALRSLGYIQ